MSVDDLVAALSAIEPVSGVTDVALGGYSGKRLDLQLPANLGCTNHYVFAEPQGICALPPGVAEEVGYDLVVADTVNHRLRGVRLADGEVVTVAGSGHPWRFEAFVPI